MSGDDDDERALARRDEPARKKSMLVGIGLGAVFPGLGLFYAAPLRAAAILTALVAVILGGLGLLGQIPVLGLLFAWLKYVAFAALAVGSGGLGALYVAGYNRDGRRTLLSERAPPDKRLPI